MGNEANAAKIIGACTYAGGSLAIVKFFSLAELAEMLTVRGQGDVGPTQRNIYRRDLHSAVRMVGNFPPASDDTAGALVLTFYRMDGTTLKTITLATMKIGNRGFTMNDEAPPGEADFEASHMGNMSTSPITGFALGGS